MGTTMNPEALLPSESLAETSQPTLASVSFRKDLSRSELHQVRHWKTYPFLGGTFKCSR